MSSSRPGDLNRALGGFVDRITAIDSSIAGHARAKANQVCFYVSQMFAIAGIDHTASVKLANQRTPSLSITVSAELHVARPSPPLLWPAEVLLGDSAAPALLAVQVPRGGRRQEDRVGPGERHGRARRRSRQREPRAARKALDGAARRVRSERNQDPRPQGVLRL